MRIIEAALAAAGAPSDLVHVITGYWALEARIALMSSAVDQSRTQSLIPLSFFA